MTDDTAQIVAARRDRNSLQPINRLPVELLTLIFTFALDHYKRDTSCAWIELFQVCFRWYDLSIKVPFLWSVITTAGGMNKERAQQLLQRSGSTLLDVHIKLEDFRGLKTPEGERIRYSPVAREILAQMHRIRSLDASLGSAHNKLLAKLQEAPKLKRLELHLPHRSDETSDISSLLPFTVVPHSLEVLKLHTEMRLKGVLRAPDIRVLHLSGLKTYGHYLRRDLFETIRGMPLLEDLCLRWVIHWPRSGENVPAIPPVDLPRLQALTLATTYHTSHGILKHLNIPTNARLDLHLQVNARDQMSHDGLAPLKRVLHVSEPNDGDQALVKHYPLRALTVQSPKWNHLEFTGCTHSGDCVDDSQSHTCSSRTLRFTFTCRQDGLRGPRWPLGGFGEVMDLLPLQKVEVLNLRGLYTYKSLKKRLGLPTTAATALAGGVYHFGPSGSSQQLGEAVDVEFERAMKDAFPYLNTFSLAYN